MTKIKNMIEIRTPKFDLYQRVTLYWNGKKWQSKITSRRYELDFGDGYGCWEYELHCASGRYFPESVIEPE